MLAACAIVAGLVVGVVGIEVVAPNSPDWVRLPTAMAWLFAVIAGAYTFGNKRDASMTGKARIRTNVLYLAIAFTFVVISTAVMVHDLDKNVHRNVKENWVICSITAVIVVGFSVNQFWKFRGRLKLWALLTAYLALHFSIGVPVLGRFDRIPAIYIWIIAMPEFAVMVFLLLMVTAPERRKQ